MKYFADFAQGSARVLRAFVYSAFHDSQEAARQKTIFAKHFE